MPRLIEIVKGGSHYFKQRLSVGLFVTATKEAVLFDSGIDDSTAKGIHTALQAESITPKAIINTHSHADHCGGNAFFQKKYPDIQILATDYEKHFIQHPSSEPACFCGGAAPLQELHNKFLEASPSRVTQTLEPYEDQRITLLGHEFQIVTLPGHTPGMIGVITPDRIFYCGDAIYGDDTFEKHGVLFYTDIPTTLKTFDKMATLPIEGCVFYHGGFTSEIQTTIKKHREKLLQTQHRIHTLLQGRSCSIDELTQKVNVEFRLPLNPTQFVLTRACVSAYVQALQQAECIKIEMVDGLLTVCSIKKPEPCPAPEIPAAMEKTPPTMQKTPPTMQKTPPTPTMQKTPPSERPKAPQGKSSLMPAPTLSAEPPMAYTCFTTFEFFAPACPEVRAIRLHFSSETQHGWTGELTGSAQADALFRIQLEALLGSLHTKKLLRGSHVLFQTDDETLHTGIYARGTKFSNDLSGASSTAACLIAITVAKTHLDLVFTAASFSEDTEKRLVEALQALPITAQPEKTLVFSGP